MQTRPWKNNTDMPLAANASVAFDTLTISVRAKHQRRWLVSVEARLRGRRSSSGDLLIQQVAPMAVSNVRSNRVQRQEVSGTGEESAVRLLASGKAERAWDGEEIGFDLDWDEDRDTIEGQRFAVPCLVLPDMLPRVTDTADPLGGDMPFRSPRISFHSELPPELDAGGISIPDQKGRATEQFLQAVMFRAAHSGPQYNDLAVAAATSHATSAQLHQAYEYASPLLAFIKEELSVSQPVRPVVCLTDVSQPGAFLPAGANCPLDPRHVGAVTANVGKPLAVIRVLALGWLGGGVRVWGENATSLELALGGAIGLRWALESGENAFLARACSDIEARVHNAEATGNWSVDDRVRAIQLPLFHGLCKRRLRRELSAIIEKRWGEFLPQDELIGILRRHGVSVPNVFA